MTRFWPLERGHIITSAYGPRWGAMHYGIDFGWPGGSAGRPVFAIQAGTVVQVGWDPGGFGWFVDIDSDDSQGSNLWVYGHIKPEVAQGEQVAAGQRIGHINGDRATNGGVDPHCHVEVHDRVRRSAGPGRMDPAPFLQGAAYPNEQQEVQPMTLFGVDISNWQKGLDLAQVKREDFRAVIAKVSEGLGFRDGTWPGFRDATRAAGLPIMGYHYLRSGDSVEAQADTFVSHLGDTTIPCMIDAEIGSGDADHVRAFRDAVERRGVRVTLLYLPRWYWSGHIGSPDLSGLPPLMASSYGSDQPGYASVLYPGDHDGAWNGYGGLDVAVLQFTQRAKVAGQQIDAWAFRGSESQLAALFGAASPGGGPVADIQQLILDQLIGPGGQGWPILGPSKVDPSRSNTLAEALAEVRDALCTPRPSFVEGSTFAADHETYGRLTDAAAYRTELAVEGLTDTVARIEKKLEGK